jgi:uncharacterized RDD family membrane protein YckC
MALCMRGPHQFEPVKYLKVALTDFSIFILLAILSVALLSSVMLFFEKTFIKLSSGTKGSLVLLSIVLVWYVYFCLRLKKTGQTFAMRKFKCKVIPIDKKQLTFGQVLWWGFVFSNPIAMFFDVINTRVPPYCTLIESRTV